MTNKHRQTQTQATPPSAVVLFGLDEHGKPKAARFRDTEAKLATKAAGQLQLKVLTVATPAVAEIAAQLPAGRIHARGRGVVPHVRADLYAKLVSAAASDGASNGSPANAAASAPPRGTPPSGKGDAGSRRPKTWDDIAAGHFVIANESRDDGWYDAVVVERTGDICVLKWRDYPRDRRFTRHYRTLALLCPNPDEGAVSASAKPTSGTKALPETWAEIGVGSLVLAATEGPWPGWWEAIPTESQGDALTLRWRDFGQLPTVNRARTSLAIIFPSATQFACEDGRLRAPAGFPFIHSEHRHGRQDGAHSRAQRSIAYKSHRRHCRLYPGRGRPWARCGRADRQNHHGLRRLLQR
jgi:hypothetical protein